MVHEVLPHSHSFLKGWIERAQRIPDPELRRQALTSIDAKMFHCEGGALYGLMAGSKKKDVIRFITAYQTISDYLDNLCDRSTSLDPVDFRALHESMLNALTPGASGSNYYRYRDEQDDGGYLSELVNTCQEVLGRTPGYGKIAPVLHELAGFYCDLQVYKHVSLENRLPNLKEWFEANRSTLPEMSWYEFSACAGSTLGIFCLVSCAQDERISEDLIRKIKDAYFPWIQGLHILMDYFVDQEEDLIGGDLNFCSYYEDDDRMVSRLIQFFKNADRGVSLLPDSGFHRMICHGLPAVYLADWKVSRQDRVKKMAREIIREGGKLTYFFYMHCLIYRRLRCSELKRGSRKRGDALQGPGAQTFNQ
jgi:tetraprenyl-beta-curcumene synthase